MHPFLLLAVDMFHWLPAWGALAVSVTLVAGVWALGRFLAHRFQCNINAAIRRCCEPLRDARVDVHAVEPAERPVEYRQDASDDQPATTDADLACADFSDDVDWFWIDATIEPRDRTAMWDPRLLELVSDEFDPAADFEVCEESGALCTLEVWQTGEFVSPQEKCMTGPQRLRMLFAAPQSLHSAKFACHYHCFGKIELPHPLAACS
jgi:hypothetical protein